MSQEKQGNLTKWEQKLHLMFQQKKDLFRIVKKKPIPDSEINISWKQNLNSSLKVICSKLFKMYFDKANVEIRLNTFSELLGVEWRRIYDIINILEGFDLVSKK